MAECPRGAGPGVAGKGDVNGLPLAAPVRLAVPDQQPDALGEEPDIREVQANDLGSAEPPR